MNEEGMVRISCGLSFDHSFLFVVILWVLGGFGGVNEIQ